MSDTVQAQHNWMKMSSIVDMACHRLGLSVDHYFKKLLEVAKWETVQLRLDRANQVKTVLLPISDVYTCQCPPDMIDVTKVGVQFGQYVRTFGLNTDLSKIDRTPGNPEFAYNVSPSWLPNGTDIAAYGFGYEFMNYNGGSLFGFGAGLPSEGHYQIKRCASGLEILLDGNIGCDELYVEGICLGINPCGETVLDPYIADYVMKKVLEVYTEEMDPNRTEGSINRRKRESAYAYTLVSGRTNSIDKDTLYNISRRAYRLTNKA